MKMVHEIAFHNKAFVLLTASTEKSLAFIYFAEFVHFITHLIFKSVHRHQTFFGSKWCTYSPLIITLCLFFQKLVATYFLNKPVNIAPAYEGKASLEVDMNRQISTLRLAKVTMEDSRRFQCSVMIPNDDEGTTAATTSLLVLGEN